MTWTYSGDPSASNLDAVRFLSGDNDETDQLVADEEVEFLLTEHANIYDAAAAVCESLASKFARQVNKSGDGLSISAGERSRQFAERAKAIQEQKAAKSTFRFVKPFAGGTSRDDKRDRDQDTDRIKTAARIDGMANHGSASAEHPIADPNWTG